MVKTKHNQRPHISRLTSVSISETPGVVSCERSGSPCHHLTEEQPTSTGHHQAVLCRKVPPHTQSTESRHSLKKTSDTQELEARLMFIWGFQQLVSIYHEHGKRQGRKAITKMMPFPAHGQLKSNKTFRLQTHRQ